MLEFVDVFCGAGGLALGLVQAGLKPVVAIDTDRGSVDTYSTNFPAAHLMCDSIVDIEHAKILERVENQEAFVVSGCPPCKYFSKLQRHRRPNNKVIIKYIDLLAALNPTYIVFENVVQIANYPIWNRIVRSLQDFGYFICYDHVSVAELGVPQKRQRLVLIASKSDIDFPIIKSVRVRTVRDAIGSLPDMDPSIPNHHTYNLSPENLKRIKRIKQPGGLSRDNGRSFCDSYGRMNWESPSPTITTKCVSFSNGRFGHPVYNRAITVREAALLQSFPMDFIFRGTLTGQAMQVGNAVPPPLGKLLGTHILKHYLATQKPVN